MACSPGCLAQVTSRNHLTGLVATAGAAPLTLDLLPAAETIGDGVSQARIHNSLTWLAEREQRLAEALGHARRALDLHRAAGHRPGQAMVLNDIGFCVMASSAVTSKPSPTASRHWPPSGSWASATGGPLPGTALGTFMISSAT